ncbi:MAG: NAD(P)-dependent oxidoreductase [Deltaproteobacteria bacterium]|nr:NAD(P)-dependent oxidoreductase [Deltaproteobacteria bacterium]
MAEILITGGAGNFGRTLAESLRPRGHEIRIFDLPNCNFEVFREWEKTQIYTGDISDMATLIRPVQGADLIFHLAAILPPASEEDKERTFRVNVQGTLNLLEACAACGGRPRIVFASSVSVYGDTSGHPGLIGPDHPVNPNDWYAESKVEAEQLLMASGLPLANLRISGIVIPAFLDPPEPWPFMGKQRIELLALSDLVKAMTSLAEGKETAFGRTLLLAGGPQWQVTGEEYVTRWGKVMDIPQEDMEFLDRPGWLNWYDTSESEGLLDYQRTSLDDFFQKLEKAVQEALA